MLHNNANDWCNGWFQRHVIYIIITTRNKRSCKPFDLPLRKAVCIRHPDRTLSYTTRLVCITRPIVKGRVPKQYKNDVR